MQRMIETAHRPVVMGLNGAVTSGHPLGSAVGLRILQRGGSAVDAIVAMAAAVGVVEPQMSGVGGDGFTLVFDAQAGRVFTVNGTGAAPTGATLDAYSDGIPKIGPRAASVPGAVGGWAAMHARWGRLAFAEVLQPAAELADQGWPVSHNLAVDFANAATGLGSFDTTRSAYFPGGGPPAPGTVLRQPQLASTLREIAASNGEALYRGALAEQLARAVQADGGYIDAESLAAYQPEITDPLVVGYRGLTVFEPGPNSTGHVLLQELAMTELADLASMRSPSAELVHQMVEIKKLAFDDRERYAADPRVFRPLPEQLLTAAYAKQRFATIDAAQSRAQATADIAADGNTTFLAAMDADGNVASMTTSINGAFGSCYVAGDTGILMNNRMTYWHLDPLHPNALAPGKRVRHTVSPAIALRDGRPTMAIGTPGADGQVQTIYQVFVNIVDFGMNLQQAVEQPRWRSFVDGQDANWPHRSSNELRIEGRMPASVIEGLQARGHIVVRDLEWSSGMGSVQVIQRDPETGVLSVGSDPRRDAYGMAY